MNLNLNHPLRRRLMNADLDAGGTDTGGKEDRGDNFTPTMDDPGAAKDPVAEAAAAATLQAGLDAKEAEKAKSAAGAATDEGETDEEKAAKRKETRIPESRHKAILEREREQRQAVERELATYKKGVQTADVNKELQALEAQVDAQEDEYNKLVADGKVAEATAKMREIRASERRLNDTRNDLKMREFEARTTEKAGYNTTLNRLEDAYPQINPDHDDFDQDVLGEVALLKAAYQATGMTPTQALQKAVSKELGAANSRQKAATKEDPAAAAPDAKAAATAARALAARQKAADMVENTPPSTTKVGADSDKLGGGLDAKGIMKMSQADFSKLPEEVLARARGDLL